MEILSKILYDRLSWWTSLVMKSWHLILGWRSHTQPSWEEIHATKLTTHSLVAQRRGGSPAAKSHHGRAGRLHSTGFCPTGSQVSAVLRRDPLPMPSIAFNTAACCGLQSPSPPNDPPSAPWGSPAPKFWISEASWSQQAMAFRVGSWRLHLFRKGAL